MTPLEVAAKTQAAAKPFPFQSPLDLIENPNPTAKVRHKLGRTPWAAVGDDASVRGDGASFGVGK